MMLIIWNFENLIHQLFDFFQQPAINVLREIEKFLGANPEEIVTIFIEDYVNSPQGLSKVFDASGLKKYWFPVSRMPQKGEDWPTVDDMVKQNQRLLVFTSKESKETSEGIAYAWRYVIESQCKFIFIPNPHFTCVLMTLGDTFILRWGWRNEAWILSKQRRVAPDGYEDEILDPHELFYY